MNRLLKILGIIGGAITLTGAILLACVGSLLVAPTSAISQAVYPVVRDHYPNLLTLLGSVFVPGSYYCAGATDQACIVTAMASGAKIVVSAGDLSLTASVSIPANRVLYLLPSAISTGNNGNFVLSGVGSKVECMGATDSTVISVPSSYSVSTGVFALTGGEPAGEVNGCTITFTQPDVSARGSLVQYAAAAIYAENAPRARFRRDKFIRAWNGIDLIGNSGGVIIEDLQASSLNYLVSIDGSLDTMRVDKMHWWPFGLTANQQIAFANSANVGIMSGRCDGLQVANSLFFGGQGISLFAGATGVTILQLSNDAFDTANGLKMGAGDVVASSTYFTPGVAGAQAIVMTRSGSFVSSFTGTSLFFETNNVTTSALVSVTAGARLNVSNSYIYGGGGGEQRFFSSGSTSLMVLAANIFDDLPNINYANPLIDVEGGSRAVISANSFSDLGTGVGTAINVSTDNFDQIVNNVLVSWIGTLPSSFTGIQALGNIGGSGNLTTLQTTGVLTVTCPSGQHIADITAAGVPTCN